MAVQPKDLWDSPLGTDGFEFVEYYSPVPEELGRLFEQMGFAAVARHRSKEVTLFRQGDVNFILNNEPGGFAAEFTQAHGPSACAMAFRVRDASLARDKALERGVTEVPNHIGPMELNISTLQVNMDKWAGFYEDVFNFREVRYFDVEGKLTGLHSRAMTSADGKIRIPINEPADDKSQIAEYLRDYHGEGIQHIALSTKDIFASVEALTARGVAFLDTPDSYYDALDDRVPGHGENVERLRADNILLDGAPTEDWGLLLQIFTDTVIGLIFFEIIQRKGNAGFGEGNFKALFDAIEEDQICRGVLHED